MQYIYDSFIYAKKIVCVYAPKMQIKINISIGIFIYTYNRQFLYSLEYTPPLNTKIFFIIRIQQKYILKICIRALKTIKYSVTASFYKKFDSVHQIRI